MIRERILRLAEEAENDGRQDAGYALYMLASTMDADGSQCTFFGDNGPSGSQLSDIGRGVKLATSLPVYSDPMED